MLEQPEPPTNTPPVEEFIQQVNAKRERCEELEIQILTSAAQINAANYRFIKLLAEFDDKGGWHGDGIRSFAHWLNWKIGMGETMGREKVRVARAITDLPLIDEAFSKGEVSYSKVRAMTRVATPENEAFLMHIAEHGTAQQMEYLVRKYAFCQRLMDENREDDWKRDKILSLFQDEMGMYEIKVC